MWVPFLYETDNYLIKITPISPYKLLLTDLKNIYSEEILDDNLNLRFQELNPLFININVPKELTQLVKNISNCSVKLTHLDTYLKLQIQTSSEDDYPITFYWQLKQGDSNMLFQEFILPLVQTVQYLEVQQCNFHQLLENKDREIEEYKREKGSEIFRAHLKTEKFIKPSASTSENLLLNMFTSGEFLEHFTTKNGDAANIALLKNAHKVKETRKRKLEPYISKHIKK